MECLKCGTKVNDKLNICPGCGSVIKHEKTVVEEEIDWELPLLKEDSAADNRNHFDDIELEIDDESVLSEATRTIKVVNSDEEEALVNEIKKKKDSKKEEESNIEKVKEVEVEEEVTPPLISLESDDSVQNRKKILMITGIATLVLLIIIGISIKLVSSTGGKSVANYSSRLEDSMKVYFETEKVDDLIYLISDYKDDEEIITDIQIRVKDTSEEWLDNYYDTEYDSSEEFEEQTTRYRNLFKGLNEYAIIKVDNDYIRALSNTDYTSINQKLEDSYNDYKVYYEALDLYKERDYDKSYYIFNQINEDSYCYVDARIYVDRIISNVVGIMKVDIQNIEEGTSNLTNKEKLSAYKQIEQIIVEYNSVYSNLDLDSYGEYKDILSSYREKVTTYNDKVSKGLGNEIE